MHAQYAHQPYVVLLSRLLALAFAFALAAPAQSASDEVDGPNPSGLIDLDFAGGTVEEFIAALRHVTPEVNIVARPGGDQFVVPPMKLRRVSVPAVMETLQRAGEHHSGGGVLQINRTGQPPIFSVNFHAPNGSTESGNHAPRLVRPISVAQVVGEVIAAEDLLTAIETALELSSENSDAAPAALRFHPETKLLIIRGHPDQIAVAHETVQQLHNSAEHARILESRRSGRDGLQHERDQLRAEAEALRAELVQLRAANEEAKLVRSHLERRFDTQAAELDHCRARAMELQHALRALEHERQRPDGGDRPD